MSDDLKTRLRWAADNSDGCGKWNCDPADLDAAADRIEELEANLQEQIEWVKSLADDLIAAEGREARLKEKLAKAVELAEKSIKWLRLYGADVHREAATLAELTGKNT